MGDDDFQDVARVVAGEVLTVTIDGMPGARLVPVPPRPLSATVLLGSCRRWTRTRFAGTSTRSSTHPWAIANQLPFYTCNPRDFRHIDGLVVVAVPVPTLEDADG